VGGGPIPRGLGGQKEMHMSTNRSAKKLTVLALAAAAIAAGVAGTQARAAGSGARPASGSGANRGNPNAVPPILPRARASELAAIRATEAWEGQEFYYHSPPGARYSSAVFAVFDAQGGAGS
jgi:hypothetical protein